MTIRKKKRPNLEAEVPVFDMPDVVQPVSHTDATVREHEPHPGYRRPPVQSQEIPNGNTLVRETPMDQAMQNGQDRLDPNQRNVQEQRSQKKQAFVPEQNDTMQQGISVEGARNQMQQPSASRVAERPELKTDLLSDDRLEVAQEHRPSIRIRGKVYKRSIGPETLERFLNKKIDALLEEIDLSALLDTGATTPLIEQSRFALFCQNTKEFIDIKEELKVGNNSSFADYVPVNNPTISKKHAVFFVKNNLLFVKDLGSSNGTTVNGIKVPQGLDIGISEEDTVVLSNEAFTIKNRR